MLLFLFLFLMVLASPAAAAIPYYSYYDPIYDSGVVEEEMMPKGTFLRR